MFTQPKISPSDDEDDIANVFVEAFNSANLTPGAHQYIGDGMDTTVSSPEHIADSENTSAHVAGDTNGPKLNPRSCVTCRRRKVRCDKREPCSNCVKANTKCVFPPPGRAPRKPRRPHDAELLKRLRRLESVVDSLGTQVDEDGNVHPSTDDRGGSRNSVVAESLSLSPQAPARKNSLEHRLGHLLIKDGRSRYVNNEFWSSLGDEIAEIKSILDDPSSEEDEDPESPESPLDHLRNASIHQAWIFGYSSIMYDMSELHPSPAHIFIIWEIFKENVDPVLKIVHVPTVKNIIMKAAVGATSLSKASESLFYSICFSAVVSMSDDQCKQLLGDEKDQLMRKYRFATEQGLARAQFLNSSNLVVLQALVMFLACVKYIDTSRSIWALSGLAMQQAQAQGLHRDGSNFKLLPFEVEMRRRLWWHISLLDARASEDHGADPTFHEHFFDTKLPLSVNDEDIWPEMTETPQEQPGASDMTFVLLRLELGCMQRKLRVAAAGETDEDQKNLIREKERLIDLTHQQMQQKYFVHCDPTVPILWVASTVGKLILAKMWLFIHHPRVSSSQSSKQHSHELKDQIFMTSVEVIEFGVLLGRSKNTAKWSWLFKTYLQWNAVAYVLSELCTRPSGADFDRAWHALDSIYDRRMIALTKSHRGILWRPLRQLYSLAQKRRREISSKSPESWSGNIFAQSESPMQTTPNGLVQERSNSDMFITANPHTDSIATSGDAFGLDFTDPQFEDMANAYSNGIDMTNLVNFNQQHNTEAFQPVESLPFGFQAGYDFLDDYGAFPMQQNIRRQAQQEWH